MKIAFETELIRDICLKADIAEAHLNSEAAASLFAIIADIKAAESAAELFLADMIEGGPGNPDLIQISTSNYLVVKLASNHQNHNGPAAERVDWSQVRRVRIVEVSNHVG